MPEPVVKWEQCLDCAVLSDVGMRRASNQDSHAMVLAPTREKWLERGHMFVVADGMGAHAAGELASKIAAETVPHTYFKLVEQPPLASLHEAMVDANQKIHNRGQANPDFHGMGTTTSALLLLPQGAVVAHVGDSRVYRLRQGKLEQLTFDHSLVWEMMAGGKLREDQVPGFVPKNIITRSLGPNAEVQVDLEGPFPLAAGDAFLLCSDGLSGQVRDEEIGAIVSAMPAKEAARALVDLANLRGGPDNITVVIVRVVAPQLVNVAAPRLEAPRKATLSIAAPRGGATAIVAAVTLLVVAVAAFNFVDHAAAPIVAVVCLVAALLIGAFVAIRKLAPVEEPATELVGKLGKGPHRAAPAAVDANFLAEQTKTLDQLREAAREAHWQVDWAKVDAQVAKAAQAQTADNLPTAAREYARAISLVLSDLRAHGQRLGLSKEERDEKL